MNRQNGRLIIAVMFCAIIGPAHASSLRIGPGLGTGVLLTANPGSFYATPATIEIGANALLIGVVPGVPLGSGIRVTFAPFLPVDPTFGRSLLTMIEADIGTRLALRPLQEGEIFLSAVVGGGLYVRSTEGTRAGGTSRRPTALIGLAAGFTTGSWEYFVDATTRALFDNDIVLAVTPAVGLRYRFEVDLP